MIKIVIDNVQIKRQEYLNVVELLVANRINVLIAALNNLNGSAISFGNDQFTKVKNATKKIVDLIDEQLNINLDGQQNYQTTLTNYINSQNNLNQLNIAGLLGLLYSLVYNQNNGLNALLTCDPSQLLTLNNNLLNNHNVNTNNNKQVLKLAFNYDAFDEISRLIKTFFRTNNFVKYCPYCNINDASFLETPNGAPATTHQLDHFFDKATYPLLAYTMFNLVPCDSICNSTNKDETGFTDEYHLNPYINGFGNNMNFFPLGVVPGPSVQSIDIKINAPYNSTEYKQLIGQNQQINEADVNGNINIFKIKTKYSIQTKKAESVLRSVQKTDKGLPSIKKYIKQLTGLNDRENYIRWYEENIGSPFKYRDFNNEAFSKLNRDIHDDYYSKDKSRSNKFIRELIADNLS